jgi:hypothetical protein
MGEAKQRRAAASRKKEEPMQFCSLYHVTSPENLPLILQDGFKDHAAKKGVPGLIVTHEFAPGVWLADVPPITAISVDQVLCHQDEAWIEVTATEAFYQRHMIGNEWRDSSWPTRQWLVPACEVNKLIRREVPLVEVLKLRLANKSTEHHAFYTAEVMRRQIANEMDGDIQARWNAALDAAALEVLS